ncbi:MAG: phage tail assembly chaperone [Halorhodospira sp.]
MRLERGESAPALERKPTLDSDLVPYWEAWVALHEARPQGMSGPMPIPYAEIASYIELTGLADPQEATYLIRRMDRAYLQHQAKSQGGRNGRTRGRDQRKRSPKGR